MGSNLQHVQAINLPSLPSKQINVSVAVRQISPDFKCYTSWVDGIHLLTFKINHADTPAALCSPIAPVSV